MKSYKLSFIVLSVVSSLVIAAEPSLKKANLKELREVVNENLKDPISSQFRKESLKSGRAGFLHADGTLEKVNVLCGEINSKNGYGAYGGFKRFISIKDVDSFQAYIDELDLVGGKRSSLLGLVQAETYLEVVQVESESLKSRGLSGALTDEKREAMVGKLFFEKIWNKYCT